jgi:hypothetical protein
VRALIDTEGPGNWPLTVAVDFDEQVYVNGFSEIALHDYDFGRALLHCAGDGAGE